MKKLKNSKILITGGAGFIGSNMVEYLSTTLNLMQDRDLRKLVSGITII